MTHTQSFRIGNAFTFVQHSVRQLILLTLCLFIYSESNAVVTITKATGGTLISADRAENSVSPLYTTLGNVIITEGAITDFAIGTNVTITLIAPSGWKFNPAGMVSVNPSPGGDISAASITSVTSTLITIQTTIAGVSNSDGLVISGIQVRANEGGNIPCSANIVRGGSAIISGCGAGAVLGNLSSTAGSIEKLVITLPGQSFSDAGLFVTSGNSGTPTNQTAGIAFSTMKIRACDQFFNVVTNYYGVKNLTYSGPSNGVTAPTYTTSVSFASGVSSTVLATTLKRAETTTISVSDGIYSGPASSPLTVGSGIHTKFVVEAATGGNIGTQTTGNNFNIRITATDANNNPCNSGLNAFTGTADISSTGILTSGSGTTPAFTAGVLSSRTMSISNGGTFTISATKTGSTETGSSNSFQVNYPGASLTGLIPACVTPGDPQFTLTVLGTNFTPTSVVRFNGVNRTTTFSSSSVLTAAITASDIATAGVYEISVFIPGTGSSAPRILDINSTSSQNISICQGESYQLPDGSFENTDGTYSSTIPSTSGCDSTIITNLTVLPNLTRSETVYFCQGTTYVLPDGSTQSSQGIYFSTIDNATGCDSLITTTLLFYPVPVISVTPVQIDCYGGRGSVTLDANSGTAPYTYGPQQTSNLIAGTYTFSVTDANSCTDSSAITIDPQPAQLLLTATPTQIACNGGTGSVDLVPSGGTPGYTLNSTPVTLLTAGTYNYQVTDDNGCNAYASAVINTAPSVLNAATTVLNTPCGASSGVATVTASGGSTPYTYEWNTIPVRTTASINGLPTGIYTVNVTDSRGCSVFRTAIVGNSNPIQVNITGSTGICPGGSVTLCATAGFATYQWSTGENTQCITTTDADSIYVTVTDTNGCSGIKSVVTRNSVPPVCSITGGALCLNSVLVLRAPLGYSSYLWSNGIRTSTAGVRSAGTYTVTIKNTDGCASTCSYTVSSPMRVTSTKTDAKCSNEFKGSANVSASAGILPYTYLWSNGNTIASATGLPGGNYSVRVTDAGGCGITSAVTINSNKTTNDYSYSTKNFNSTPISQNSYIWFSAVANITHTGNYPVTITFINQNINTVGLNLVPANAKLIITNAVSQASTVFTGGEWVTTAPPDLSGNYFVSGFAYQTPTAIAPSLSSVKWRGIWTSSSSCVTSVRWKWSAATYSNFTTLNSSINVQPVDDASASPYGSSDLAGTPENYKPFCIPGALSIGAPDFVGTYTSIVTRIPCSTPDICSPLRLAGFDELENGSTLLVNAYPNPFNSKTNIDFGRVDLSGRVYIEIYSLFGEKIQTIFDDYIDAGIKYTAEFDASDFAGGIYFYKVICEGEEVRGKLYLQK
ncbi:MAG: hypothetical protein IPP27_16530 [Bacteroidetes bacterium]|nr:hypothetical protein [Bacteroidota bacterium]